MNAPSPPVRAAANAAGDGNAAMAALNAAATVAPALIRASAMAVTFRFARCDHRLQGDLQRCRQRRADLRIAVTKALMKAAGEGKRKGRPGTRRAGCRPSGDR